ncbi:MAG TPA: hypothetical protein PK659_08155 [Methanothrix sp.]|nr:hypothetical protein [Methanothrix sp.]HOK58947.1 hypothetical protein [Methanothrix sp.]HOL44206.1 hypothetical protein [Methanothrix sp.]HPO89208.1 hypothetical protein [Methanothrix sp.]
MDRKQLEIITSTGMVLALIAMLIAIQLVLPETLRPLGFVGAVALYIILMSLIGLRLVGACQQI